MADPSGCPFVPAEAGLSGTKCPSGSGAHFPEDLAPVSDSSEPKLLVSLRPCDPVAERTFPVFCDLLNTRDWSGDLSAASARRFPSSAPACAFAGRQSPVRFIQSAPSASLSGFRLRAPPVNLPPASKPCSGLRVPDFSFPPSDPDCSVSPTSSLDFSFLLAAFAPLALFKYFLPVSGYLPIVLEHLFENHQLLVVSSPRHLLLAGFMETHLLFWTSEPI
jgi:hypothetical protein